MPTSLPALGTLQYGPVTFGSYVLSEFSARPVYDQAGRTVVYVIYTFRVKTKIILPTDSYMDTLQTELLKPAQPLLYTNRGGGNFVINTTGPKDVLWGPRPTLFDLRQEGGGSVEIDWGCEVAVPRCNVAQYTFALMEVNYNLTVTEDSSGFSRRTISGFLRIPQTRLTADSRILRDTADSDAYWLKVLPDLPQGFRRVSKERRIDESKCKLNFTFVDEEMPRPLPPNVISCEASHELRQTPKNYFQWTGTLTASYEMARDTPRGFAWTVFLVMLRDRLDKAKQFGKLPPDVAAGTAFILPVSFTYREPDIFGKNKFEASCTYTLTTTPATFLAASGLWKKVAGADDSLWRASSGNVALLPRGWAGLTVGPQNDFIIDLCLSREQKALTAGGVLPGDDDLDENELRIDLPQPENSWLRYDSELSVVPIDQLCVHKPLQATMKAGQLPNPGELIDPQNNQQFGKPGTFTSTQGSSTFYSEGNAGRPTGIFQYRSSPDIPIILEGAAVRAGYLIEPPSLTSVNGAPVTPANIEGECGFKSKILANWCGVPIIGACWRFRYLLTQVPDSGIAVPPNPQP